MEKNTAGRPTDYKEEYPEKLIEHMSRGNSFWSFAAKIRCSFDTLHNWCEKHPQFSEARKIGTALLLEHDEAIGKGGTLGQLERRSSTIKTKTIDKSGNVIESEETIYRPAKFASNYHQFVMKNRYPRLYKDRYEIDAPKANKEKANALVKQAIDQSPELEAILKNLAKEQSEL